MSPKGPVQKEKAAPTPAPSSSDKPVASPTTKAPGRKRKGSNTGFSISGTLAGHHKVKEEEAEFDENKELAPQEGKPREDFTQDQLDNFYQQYIEHLRQQNKPRILAALAGKNPKLQEPEHALLTFENNTQENFYVEARLPLLRFLRQKLNNYHLTIETKVLPGSQQTEPYSPQEKYEYMLKKNPHLAELRQRLNLDLE